MCIRPSPHAALRTENGCGWRKRLPGECSASPLPGQGSSQLYFGCGGSSDALRRAVGWLAGLEEHQNDFILEICPCGALGVPWLSQPRAGWASGTCCTHDCARPVSPHSAGSRAGQEGSQARVRSRSLWHAEPNPGFILPFFFLFFFFLSFFPGHVFQVDSTAERG